MGTLIKKMEFKKQVLSIGHNPLPKVCRGIIYFLVMILRVNRMVQHDISWTVIMMNQKTISRSHRVRITTKTRSADKQHSINQLLIIFCWQILQSEYFLPQLLYTWS